MWLNNHYRQVFIIFKIYFRTTHTNYNISKLYILSDDSISQSPLLYLFLSIYPYLPKSPLLRSPLSPYISPSQSPSPFPHHPLFKEIRWTDNKFQIWVLLCKMHKSFQSSTMLHLLVRWICVDSCRLCVGVV